MTNIRKEREDITKDTMDIKSIMKEKKGIIKEYYEQLYARKFIITQMKWINFLKDTACQNSRISTQPEWAICLKN